MLLVFTLQRCIIVYISLLHFNSAIIFSSLPILTFALPPYLVEVWFDQAAITAMESNGTARVCLFAMSENPIEVTVMVVTTTTGTATGRIYHIISDYSKLHTWKSSNYLLWWSFVNSHW